MLPPEAVRGEGEAPVELQSTRKIPTSILPVMDLRYGQVVRAIAGQREHYQPLQTDWLPEPSNPLSLIHAVRERWNLCEWYVADLDAIEGRPPQQQLIKQLLASGSHLWLDAGNTSLHQMNDWLSLPLTRLILGSETLQADDWASLLPHHPQRHRLAFSLDLHQGTPRTQPGSFTGCDAWAIVEEIYRWGIRTLIVLDVADVGTAQGCSTSDLCQRLHHQWPDLQLVAGGGIRSEADIHALERAGSCRVLVSTWLHSQTTSNSR